MGKVILLPLISLFVFKSLNTPLIVTIQETLGETVSSPYKNLRNVFCSPSDQEAFPECWGSYHKEDPHDPQTFWRVHYY